MNVTLSQYVHLLRKLDYYEERVTRLENRMHSVRISEITDMPRGGNGDFDQYTDNLYKLNNLRAKRNEIKIQIVDINRNLSRVEIQVIRYRYIDELSWRRISEKICFSQRQTIRIHKKILEKFEKTVYKA